MILEAHPIKIAVVDTASLFVVAGTILSYLPSIAAALSIAWYLYRFYKIFTTK